VKPKQTTVVPQQHAMQLANQPVMNLLARLTRKLTLYGFKSKNFRIGVAINALIGHVDKK